jgi:hypothetical protein
VDTELQKDILRYEMGFVAMPIARSSLLGKA